MYRPPSNLAQLVDLLLGIINLIIPFLFGLTLVVIIWKLIDGWIINAADEKKRSSGKAVIATGIVVLVIMLGIWGIIAFLRRGIFGV